MTETARPSSVYSTADYDAIQNQIRLRAIAISVPCVLLLAGVIVSLILRVEAVTTVCTILIGAILIFCWDLFLKPLCAYRKYIRNVLFGITHEAQLPFVSLSEDVNMVDGVACYSLTCQDTDAKGRPYDRLFYFDAQKDFPQFEPGEMLRIVHHDLVVADVTRA